MVARSDFAFDVYPDVIKGLIKKEWRLQELIYLDLILEQEFGITEKREDDYFTEIQAWFDFENLL